MSITNGQASPVPHPGRAIIARRNNSASSEEASRTLLSSLMNFCKCCPCICPSKEVVPDSESRSEMDSNLRPSSVSRPLSSSGQSPRFPRFVSWIILKSCCFTNIRQGSLYSGFYTLVFYTMFLVAGSVHMDIVWANVKMRTLTIILLILFMFTVFTSILLIIAIITKNDWLMIPWLIATLFTTLIDFAITIFLLIDPNPSATYFFMVFIDVAITGANFLCFLCVLSYFITIVYERKYSRQSLSVSVNLTTVTTIQDHHHHPMVPRDGDAGPASIIEEEIGKMNKSSSLITQESGLINYNKGYSPRTVTRGEIQSTSSITESGIISSPARQLNREKHEMEERDRKDKEMERKERERREREKKEKEEQKELDINSSKV